MTQQRHWRREAAALSGWQLPIRHGKQSIYVSDRTYEILDEEARRRTESLRLNAKIAANVDPWWPGDVVDYMVMLWSRQKALPFISKRRYSNRIRRGW